MHVTDNLVHFCLIGKVFLWFFLTPYSLKINQFYKLLNYEYLCKTWSITLWKLKADMNIFLSRKSYFISWYSKMSDFFIILRYPDVFTVYQNHFTVFFKFFIMYKMV